MARIVKEHAVRRNEILDVTQKLVYSKGYEQMTIQDILDDLQISKGAFYHYFDSKQALLEALIERMQEEVEKLLLPIVRDPNLPALEKFQRFFAALTRWKTERKSFLLALLDVWYADDNALVRQKAQTASIKAVIPLLVEIIRQGIQEGVLTTTYPDHIGGIVMAIFYELSDSLARLLLSKDWRDDDLQRLESIVAAHSDALERVLGAPRNSLQLTDTETLKEWLFAARERG